MYILLTETFAMSHFMSCMERRQLLTSGLYAVIAVEEEMPFSATEGTYLSKQHLSNQRTASQTLDLRGLLVIASTPPSNLNYSDFKREVNRRSHIKPFRIPYHRSIAIKVPVFAGFAYDSVVILAKAFHKVLQNGGNVNSGKQVIEAMKNLSFKSDVASNL